MQYKVRPQRTFIEIKLKRDVVDPFSIPIVIKLFDVIAIKIHSALIAVLEASNDTQKRGFSAA